MTHHPIFRPALQFTALLLVSLTMLLGARATAAGVRSWVDEDTAVAVTAQQRAWNFYRLDVQAGVKVYNFADLGALEINQSGKRRQYICLLEWSTVTAPILHKDRVLEDFSTLVVWADDQSLSFKRYAQNNDGLHLGETPFKRYVSSALENYYEVSLAQLAIMSEAKTLRIAAANQPPGQALYQTAREEHGSLVAFTKEIFNTANLANPAPPK